jgi:hypothetical protein
VVENKTGKDNMVKDNTVKDNMVKDNVVENSRVKDLVKHNMVKESHKDNLVKNILVKDNLVKSGVDQDKQRLCQAEARQSSAGVPFQVPSYSCLGKHVSTTVGVHRPDVLLKSNQWTGACAEVA